MSILWFQWKQSHGRPSHPADRRGPADLTRPDCLLPAPGGGDAAWRQAEQAPLPQKQTESFQGRGKSKTLRRWDALGVQSKKYPSDCSLHSLHAVSLSPCMHAFKKERNLERKGFTGSYPFLDHISSKHCCAYTLVHSNQINLKPQCHPCIQNSSFIKSQLWECGISCDSQILEGVRITLELCWESMNSQVPPHQECLGSWFKRYRHYYASRWTWASESRGMGIAMGKILTWCSRSPASSSGSIPGCVRS